MADQTMLDLPSVFTGAYRAMGLKNLVNDQNRARQLSQIMNQNTNTQGQLNQPAAQAQGSRAGMGFDVAQQLSQLNDAQQKKAMERIKELDTSAWALLDEYNDDVKTDPETADAKLQANWDKMTVNDPELYQLRQSGKLPTQVNHQAIVQLLGKSQYHYKMLENLQAKTTEQQKMDQDTEKRQSAKDAADLNLRTNDLERKQKKDQDDLDLKKQSLQLMKDKLNKGTPKEAEAEKNIKALADEYETTEDEVRAVQKSYKTLAEENFPKALAKYRLEKGKGGGGIMSEADARKALADKGIKGKDADTWIQKYKAAGKVQ